ncbi:MAG: hypothetical protein ACFFKA_07705, partial [Candidatus Thorarchaeota archaeon]
AGFKSLQKKATQSIFSSLKFGIGGEIYYEFRGSAPNNYLVIQYHNIYSNDNNYIGNFEVILNRSGSIKFQYLNIDYLSQYDAIVGLDHGDLINYNCYSDINKSNLPYLNKAIEFSFNELSAINYSLNVAINKEYTWIVTGVDNFLMDQIFGTNWESLYGIFPEPQKITKFKINITSIVENSTHWDINYSIWNWTNLEDAFNTTPDGNDLLTFRKEPLNYTIPHNLTNIFPFFVPNPIFHYLNRSNLTESYSRISSFESDGNYVELGDIVMSSTIIGGHNIQFGRNAHYNNYGILDWMDFYFVNQSDILSGKKSIFTIYNFYESSKPSFIGVSQSEVYNYGVFYSERNAPQMPLRNYSNIPKLFSLQINFIGGLDPYFNRVLICTNNSAAAFTINPFSGGNHPEIYYLTQNLTRFSVLNRFILPMNVNWSTLEFIRSDIIALLNGFIISMTILNDTIKFEYNYTLSGMLSTYSEYNNGKEYFTIRLNNFNYQIDDSDPIINILLPFDNQTFGKIAPSYNITIIEPNIDKIWYTLDGGLTNITITSLNGKINQTLWNNLPEGPLIIRFYVNDTMGYLGYKDVSIFKRYEPEVSLIVILILTGAIGSMIAASGTSYYYFQKLHKRRSREITPLFETEDQFPQSWIRAPSKELLNNISNKEFLLNLFDSDKFPENKSGLEKLNLTTISNDFLTKVDSLGFDEHDKKEFLREMLALKPKEREDLLVNIISRQPSSSDQISRKILSNITNKDLLLQIFDENVPSKKRAQLEKIELTTVSEKFLNKIDALGLREDMKIEFIKEMLALSPRERDTIMNNILDKLDDNDINT